MTWATPPSIIGGSTFTAGDWNTYVKGNLDTLFPYTAGKQIAVSNSTSSLSTIAASAALQVVRVSTAGSAIEFGETVPIQGRMGTDLFSWRGNYGVSTTSISTFSAYTTFRKPIIQCGAVHLNTTTGTTVYFPVPFLIMPLVFCGRINLLDDIVSPMGIASTASFEIYPQTATGDYFIHWMAIGEILR